MSDNLDTINAMIAKSWYVRRLSYEMDAELDYATVIVELIDREYCPTSSLRIEFFEVDSLSLHEWGSVFAFYYDLVILDWSDRQWENVRFVLKDRESDRLIIWFKSFKIDVVSDGEIVCCASLP